MKDSVRTLSFFWIIIDLKKRKCYYYVVKYEKLMTSK